MDWPKLIVKNWLEFTDLIRHLDVGPPSSKVYVFRGQSNSEWSLIPSLTRSFPKEVNESRALQIERVMEKQFTAQAHLHVSKNVIPSESDYLSWLALMQHYNAPTRLLDWTGSVYIAAFFAVVENWDKDGAIWYFHNNTLVNEMKKTFGDRYNEDLSRLDCESQFRSPNQLDQIYTFERKTKSDRMIIQQGIFTVCTNILADHANAIIGNLVGNTDKEFIRIIIIPKNQKPTFLRSLRSMNITANSLFPGIDGLGRSLRELVQLEVLFNPN